MNMTTLAWKIGFRFIAWGIPSLVFLACSLNGEQVKKEGALAENERAKNPILALSISGEAESAELTIEAEGPIVYTTYPQLNPRGVVIEIASGVWGVLEGPFEVNRGPIRKIVNKQIGYAFSPLARMEVLLEEESHYDVRLIKSNRLNLHFLRKRGEKGENETKPEEANAPSAQEVNVVKNNDPEEMENIEKLGNIEEPENIDEQENIKEPENINNDMAVSPIREDVTIPTARKIVDFLITRESENARVVLIGDGEFRDFSYFLVTEPDRVVIDIWDVRRMFERSSFSGDGVYFDKVRFGDHPDKVRVVIDVITKDGALCSLKRDANKLVFQIGRGIEGEENSILVADLPTSAPEKIRSPAKDDGAAEEAIVGFEEERAKRNATLQPAAHLVVQESSPANVMMTDASWAEVSSVSWLPGEGKEVGTDLLLRSNFFETQPASVESPAPVFPRIHAGLGSGKVYAGRLVNLDFQDIQVHNVFRLLADISNLNIVVDDKVKGKITMRLHDVPWDQALDLILTTKDLGMIVDGNIRRIAPLKDLRRKEKEIRRAIEERAKALIKAQEEREKAAIEARERRKELEPLVTETIFLNYSKVAVVKSQLDIYMTKRGTIVPDSRTNSLTIRDVKETIETIKNLLKIIDKATPQVMIEARIVEADRSFSRSLGVQWGADALIHNPNDSRYIYGVYSGAGTAYQPNVPDPNQANRWANLPVAQYAVNFPASGASPASMGIKFGQIVGDIISLDLKLSLSEAEGHTRIISRPKITTMDNIQATIKSGESIPYETVSQEGTNTTLVDAVLELTVTPHVTPDGRVKMEIKATKNGIGSFRSASGAPSITKREATTQVLVRSGETTVIGGIFKQEKVTSMQAVPWISKIPILGWLFKSKTWENKKEELLIFITPFIIREEKEKEATS